MIRPTDNELLLRYSQHRDDEAFRELLERHGPLVQGVCRRVLRQEQDVEDAFQATFLVLARQASSIRSRHSVGSWLFKIAHRTSVRAVLERSRRGESQLETDVEIPSATLEALQQRELFEQLVEELNRLPERYRSALILFYLEGRSRRHAAEELEITDAALKARLSRARNLLRHRLARRGVALSVAAATMASAGGSPVQAALVNQTIETAGQYAFSGTVSVPGAGLSVSLAEGIRPMASLTLTKTTIAATAVTAAGILVAIGLGSLGADEGTTPRKVPGKARIDTRVDRLSGDSAAGGAVAVLPAAGGSGATTSEATTEAKKIQAALDEKVDIKFSNMSLADAIQQLSQTYGINIVLNRKSLADVGVAPDERVDDVELAGLSLRSVLRIVLKKFDLMHRINGEILEVVADESRKSGLGYAVGDLVFPIDGKLGIAVDRFDDSGKGSGSSTSVVTSLLPTEQKIEAALEKTTEIEFLDTPLSDAMEFLSDVHKIPIIIDEQALAEDGIATDEPLNRTLRGLRLDSALNILLKDLRLTYYVDNEVMTITTEVVEDERTETRIYPIGNLVSLGIDHQALEDLLNPDNDIEVHLLGANVVVKQSQSRHRETAELFEMLARAAGQKSK